MRWQAGPRPWPRKVVGHGLLACFVIIAAVGCIAPGQGSALAAKSFTNTVHSGASPSQAPAAFLGEPLIIEISIGNVATPWTWIAEDGKTNAAVEALARDFASARRDQYDKLKPKARTNLLQQASLVPERLLAAERLHGMSELYHALELAHALRTSLPKARVLLSVRDQAEVKAQARSFELLRQAQDVSLGLPPPPFSANWPWGPWALYGVAHKPAAPTVPAGLTLEFDLRRAGDANSALDAGGTFGRILNLRVAARAGQNPVPVFSSADDPVKLAADGGSDAAIRKVLSGAPEKKTLGKVKQERLGYDPGWLAYWFGKAPSEQEWKEYQSSVRARAHSYAKQIQALSASTLFEVDKESLKTNGVPIGESPFMPIQQEIVRRMVERANLDEVRKAQTDQISRWTIQYDPSVRGDARMLTPQSLPAGRERSLGSMLNAELHWRERLIDLLIRDQYAGALGEIVRTSKYDEEQVASKIKGMRRTALVDRCYQFNNQSGLESRSNVLYTVVGRVDFIPRTGD